MGLVSMKLTRENRHFYNTDDVKIFVVFSSCLDFNRKKVEILKFKKHLFSFCIN